MQVMWELRRFLRERRRIVFQLLFGSASASLTNPLYHALIFRFRDLTGCPVLVNTSFNVSGEPIVCTPEDAFRCFMRTEIDLLVVGNCILRKEAQASFSETG